MAGKKGTSLVDIRRTRASKKDMEELSNSLARMVGDVNRLQKAYQALGSITKRTQVNAAHGIGLDKYRAGQRTRASTQAAQTAFQGTDRGVKIADLKLRNQQERESLRLLDAQKLRRAAIGLELNKELKKVHQITTAEGAKNKLHLVEQRLLIEAGRGNAIRIGQTRQLQTALQRRIVSLREELRLKKQSTQLSREEQIAQSRKDTRSRLFGDGGASLFAIQAGLMANYKIMGGLQRGAGAAARFTVELDEALRNLQAIVRITNTDIESLKGSLIEISEQTKFTAVEVANAAVILGQSGFSVSEIEDSVAAVTLLATATGTDLNRAVDIATSTLGVFNMQSSDMGRVADVMTEAINSSKLNIERLTLGLQYSGNIAAQSGVRFEELTAAMGAMANAGIRSGSTIGTGMRQILIGLQKPSNAFLETLARLGLNLSDVDLRSKGLYGALKNLSDAGFTAKDAIQSFEIRAAAAFNAIQGNLGQVLELESSFRNTSAAVEANAVQMLSLANQGKRLGSVLGSIVAIGLEPMKNVLIEVTKRMADFFSVIKEGDKGLQTAFTGVVLTLGAVSTIIGGRLLKGLFAMVRGTAAGTAGIAAMTGVTTTAVGSMGLWATVLKVVGIGFRALLGPIGLAISAVTLAIGAFKFFGQESKNVAEGLTAARTAFDRSAGDAEKMRGAIEGVSGQLLQIRDRYEEINNDAHLLASTLDNVRNQFIKNGRDASHLTGNIDEVTQSLRELRTELAEEYVLKVSKNAKDLESLVEANKADVDLKRKNLMNRFAAMGRIDENPQGGGRTIVSDFMSGTGAGLLNPDAKAADFRSIKVNMEAEMARIQKEFGEDISKYPEEVASKFALLGQVLPDVIEALHVAVRGLRLDDELTKIKENLKFGGEQLDPRVMALVDRARDMSTSVPASVRDAGFNPMAPVIDNHANAMEAQKEGQARVLQAEMEIQRLVDEGVIATEQMKGVLSGYLNLASTGMLAVTEGLDEESDKAQASIDKIRVERAKASLSDLSSKVSKAETGEDVGKLSGQRIEALYKVFEAELTALKGESLDPGVFAESKRSLTERLSKALSDIFKDSDDRVAQLDKDRAARAEKFRGEKSSSTNDINLMELEAKYGRDSLEYEREKLSIQHESEALRIRGLDTLSSSERIYLALLANKQNQLDLDALQKKYDEMGVEDAKKEIATLQEQVRIKRLINIFGEDSVVVAKARHSAERENFREAVKTRDVSEELKKELMGAYDAANKFQYVDMASPIEKALGVARQLLDVMGRVGAPILDAQQALKRTKIAGQHIGDEAGKARALAEFDFKAGFSKKDMSNPVTKMMVEGSAGKVGDLASQRAEAEAANAAAQKAWDKANNPKKGGGKKDKTLTEFEKLIQRLENTAGSAKLKEGLGGLSAIQGALGEARSQLEMRDEVIGRISEKVRRTAEEEKRLNELLDERRTLNEYIEQQESEILRVKGLQGQIQMDLNQSIKDWADTNLDINQAAENGLSNTLNAMKSGFAELFIDLTSGAKSAGQAFLDFGVSVVQAMQQAIAEMLAVYAMQQLIGMAFPGAGAGDGSLGGTAMKFFGMKNGGRVKRKASGGRVHGTAARDSVPHLLMPDEYVLRSSAARAIGYDELDNLNAMGNRSLPESAKADRPGKDKPSVGKDINIYLLDERSSDGGLGPDDIVAVISDDMSRGGTTKRLIKSIQSGDL